MKNPQKYRMAMGQAIVERREKLVFSRDKLARIIGVTVDYMASIEQGGEDLRLSEMLCISRALNMPPSTLLATAECILSDDDSI